MEVSFWNCFAAGGGRLWEKGMSREALIDEME